eukprot:3413334-Pyramimonas_sp.AAC.1
MISSSGEHQVEDRARRCGGVLGDGDEEHQLLDSGAALVHLGVREHDVSRAILSICCSSAVVVVGDGPTGSWCQTACWTRKGSRRQRGQI